MPFVTNEAATREIIDCITGERTVIGGSTTEVIIGPNGERIIIERELSTRTHDRRVIGLRTELFACGCGCPLTLLVRESIVFCGICQIPLAIIHAKTWDDGLTRITVCPSCWMPGHTGRAIKRFLRWLFLS